MPICKTELQTCPRDPGELAEDYCLGRLPAAESRAFEEHYLACPRCASVAEDTYDFIEAFRVAAAAQARPKGERVSRAGKVHSDTKLPLPLKCD